MTYTGNLDQIKEMLTEDGLTETPADGIQTGDVSYNEGTDGITLRLAVEEDLGTDDLEAYLDDAYLSRGGRDDAASKRYSIRAAGLTDPSGFYVDDIIGGFTARIEDGPERRHVRMDFSDYSPDEAIEEAYRLATRLDDDNSA